MIPPQQLITPPLCPDTCGGECVANICCQCAAICGNPDLAGIGVRLAFYIQSVMNALLVVLSPSDSVASAWGSTLLTSCLIIAAIVQKYRNLLSLHHATLVLVFATLSCISSLTAAPMLPIWRLSPPEYYAQELHAHILPDVPDDEHDIFQDAAFVNRHKKTIKDNQTRQRKLLALALMIQVLLQWTWGIILFVSPSYAQQACSYNTNLVLFLYPFTTGQINIGRSYIVWPIWLLACLFSTIGLSIMMAITSPSRAGYNSSALSAVPLSEDTVSPPFPILETVFIWYQRIPSWKERDRLLLWCFNTIAIIIWALLIVTIERQRALNLTDNVEDDFTGFGQITAFVLAFVPLWSVIVALYRYPKLRRRIDRHERHQRELSSASNLSTSHNFDGDQSPIASTARSNEEETSHLLSPYSPSFPTRGRLANISQSSDMTLVSNNLLSPPLELSEMTRRAGHKRKTSDPDVSSLASSSRISQEHESLTPTRSRSEGPWRSNSRYGGDGMSGRRPSAIINAPTRPTLSRNAPTRVPGDTLPLTHNSRGWMEITVPSLPGPDMGLNDYIKNLR
ncbi:hypothetical protein ABKN59_006787 [Abortiporus biennis]